MQWQADRSTLESIAALAENDGTSEIGVTKQLVSRMRAAYGEDRDQFLKDNRLSASLGLPIHAIGSAREKAQIAEAIRNAHLASVAKDSPAVAEYLLRSHRNAVASREDIHTLSALDREARTRAEGVMSALKDTGIDLVSGTLSLAEGAIGLADIVTFDAIGTALDSVGIQPGVKRQVLSQHYSQKRKDADLFVSQAEGLCLPQQHSSPIQMRTKNL